MQRKVNNYSNCDSAHKSCLLQVAQTKDIAALTQFCDFLVTCYIMITLVVPNYEAAPILFYSEHFGQKFMTYASAAHQEIPMGIISSIW